MRAFKMKAFTLIELLIVVAIIAILAAIAVPNMLEAQTRAKISRSKADMRTIATAMEAYAVDNNKYPPDWDSGIYGSISPPGEWKSYRHLSTPIAYITSAPTDPFSSRPDSKPNGYYDYWGYDATVKAKSLGDPIRESWTRLGLRWYIYSWGPDRVDQDMGGNQYNVVDKTYDPTNGTISAGDLGRCNLGVVPNS